MGQACMMDAICLFLDARNGTGPVYTIYILWYFVPMVRDLHVVITLQLHLGASSCVCRVACSIASILHPHCTQGASHAPPHGRQRLWARQPAAPPHSVRRVGRAAAVVCGCGTMNAPFFSMASMLVPGRGLEYFGWPANGFGYVHWG